MLKTSKISCFVFFLFTIFPNYVFAQITVTSDDILGLLGATQTMAIGTGSITVDVGSPGANQTWDFRSVATNSTIEQAFLAPGETPFASDFPKSVLVQKVTLTPDSTIYNYFEINSTILSNVGIGVEIPLASFVLQCDITTPLPFAFGSQWTANTSCTSPFITINTASHKTVDAWGIVRLATAELECLRICSRDTIIIAILFVGSDTTEIIKYDWITKSNYIVAAVSSQDGETNPNFTDASVFQMTTDGIVPVELVSFSAEVAPTEVTLSWTTASESNNFGFDIEKGFSNDVFSKIAFVAGHGTTNQPRHYTFTDGELDREQPVRYYRLKQIDLDGTFSYSSILEVQLAVPNSFTLNQNYPNPFNPVTTIRYLLPKEERVTLKIYNILGEEVTTLVNDELKQAGYHTAVWDGRNVNGRSMASGAYLIQMRAGSFVETIKALLIE